MVTSQFVHYYCTKTETVMKIDPETEISKIIDVNQILSVFFKKGLDKRKKV